MNIGIIGAGTVGTTLASALVQLGHAVRLSYARDPQQLQARAEQLGVVAATPSEAAASAEVIILAPRFVNLAEATALMGSVEGKIVIDATNPYDFDNKGLIPLNGRTAMQDVEAALPGARVVKAFNSVSMQQFSEERGRGKVLFFAGDDAAACAVVEKLLSDLGFEPMNLGGATQARHFELPGPLFLKIYTPAEAASQVEALAS